MVDLSEAKSNSVNNIKLQMEASAHGEHTSTPIPFNYINKAKYILLHFVIQCSFQQYKLLPLMSYVLLFV